MTSRFSRRQIRARPSCRRPSRLAGTGITHLPKWTVILSEKHLEEIRGLFEKGLNASEVAGLAGIPAPLFESWIGTGEMLGIAYATHISYMEGDITARAGAACVAG